MKTGDKIVLIWPNFSFYHIARFKALYKKIGDRLLGIELIGGIGDYETFSWRYDKRDNLPIITLFPDCDIKDVSRGMLGRSIVNTLKEHGAETIFVNGYSTQEYRIVINWAYAENKKCFIFSESKRDDHRRFFLKELFKTAVIKKLKGAICGGRLHKEYLTELGMPAENIFFGYDVVDNDFFRENGALARKDAGHNREKYALPEKYFLTCSRLTGEKNLMRLVGAYSLYRREAKGVTGISAPWSLVICGAGPQEHRLKTKIRRENIEGINFAGVQKPEELAVYYGLAGCFILASTREPWGLVINEAMASGLPVIATRISGAASELVFDGLNGYKFNPLDVREMAGLMLKMTRMDSGEILEMGRRAQAKIALYSPEYFAESVIKAANL
ncbi:MAG: glycosyltransferase family 4 protein [Candidatus Omnitrophica bacterium]|nr:glycosyltransferase family 4 protein [Candidatus Omnitrophota bacterium]